MSVLNSALPFWGGGRMSVIVIEMLKSYYLGDIK